MKTESTITTGQIWRNQDTGNRWRVVAVVHDGTSVQIGVRRCNPPPWDDGLYYFHPSQFNGHSLVLES